MNDMLLGLVEEHGLKAVLESLATTCNRKAQFAADDEESDESEVAWELDATTIRNCLPVICND